MEVPMIQCGKISYQFPTSHFPLYTKNKGEMRDRPKAKNSTCSFQAYGFGLGSVRNDPLVFFDSKAILTLNFLCTTCFLLELQTKQSNLPPIMASEKSTYKGMGTSGNLILNPIFQNHSDPTLVLLCEAWWNFNMTLTSTIGYPTESIKSCYQMHLPLQRAQ
jgi:hypothetical protein